MSGPKLPDDVKAEDVIHPRTGLFFRNPSNTNIRDRAHDQSQIVRNLTEAKRKREQEIFSYMPNEGPYTLPGVLKIRTLEVQDLQQLFKSMMRIRPNILKIHIKLGIYPSQRPINHPKVTQIGSTEARYSTEIANDFAEVFSDKRLMITELIYTVQSAELGNFMSTCEAFGTTEQEYNDDKLFNPGVMVEYYKNA